MGLFSRHKKKEDTEENLSPKSIGSGGQFSQNSSEDENATGGLNEIKQQVTGDSSTSTQIPQQNQMGGGMQQDPFGGQMDFGGGQPQQPNVPQPAGGSSMPSQDPFGGGFQQQPQAPPQQDFNQGNFNSMAPPQQPQQPVSSPNQGEFQQPNQPEMSSSQQFQPTQQPSNSDSLFDLSELDMSSPSENHPSQQSDNSSNLPSSTQSYSPNFSSIETENQSVSTQNDDLDIESSSSLSERSSSRKGSSELSRSTLQDNIPENEERTTDFSRGNFGSSEDEVIYITTAQFKNMLEIIDNVRSRVKESAEKHTRLLDIKSEEDIEYENLRKDFQYIEDKLYEVDSLLFER